MEYTINSLKEVLLRDVNIVYDVFKEFFGEVYTDIQGTPTEEAIRRILQHLRCSPNEENDTWEISDEDLASIKDGFSTLRPEIYIHWPRVTVTNENDRSVVIQDLYAKIEITMQGTIPYENTGFQLTRSTFPEVQYASGYSHSHLPHFSGVPYFANPCLGTGPIKRTIADLKNESEEALWMLFCRELSLYVTVESLAGGPYFRMETIGNKRKLRDFGDYDTNDNLSSSFWNYNIDKEVLFKQIIREFTRYYLKHGHLNFGFTNNVFVPGMSYFDFIIDISNSFIEFFNKYGQRVNVDELYRYGIIVKSLAASGQFYEDNQSLTPHDYSQYEGQRVLTFKGQDINLHIEQATVEHTETTLLLHHQIAMYILHKILKIINYRYRNEHTNNRGSQKALTSTYQAVCYL